MKFLRFFIEQLLQGFGSLFRCPSNRGTSPCLGLHTRLRKGGGTNSKEAKHDTGASPLDGHADNKVDTVCIRLLQVPLALVHSIILARFFCNLILNFVIGFLKSLMAYALLRG